MKKRFLSVFLALVLCMGLAVPAFAAKADDILTDINEDSFWLDIKDESGLKKEVSVRLRYWYCDDEKEGSRTWTKETEARAAKELEVIELPLGVTITAGATNKWTSGIWVFSDPDGDGIYDQRLMTDVRDGSKMGIVPLAEAGPFSDDSSTTYDHQFYWSYGLNWFQRDSYKGYQILTTDYLVKLFGPNTLLEFWDDARGDKRHYLLTGEKRPESMAYDKLEDYGIHFSNFGDLVSAWAVASVDAAGDAGLISYKMEVAHSFDLRGKITRGEFATTAVYLYEAMSGKTVTLPKSSAFKDVPEDHDHFAYIAAAYELGIVGGMPDGTFAPDALVTREQAATMLSRVFTKLGGKLPKVDATSFADDGKISAYAKDAVAFMFGKNIIGGVGNNKFDPQGNATVEQALKIAVEMMNNLEVE